ncbi:unnamed protein product [Auanema sp. JU1783]|nr:unnamed protein product [Auanema sp. JU1783]
MNEIKIVTSKERPRHPPEIRLERIGEFTVGHNDGITLGRSKARYIYVKGGDSKLNYDLNKNFDTWKKKEDKLMKDITDWIMLQGPPDGKMKKSIYNADFVCFRGLLTKVGCAAFVNRNDSWEARAIKIDGIIYICEVPTPEELERRTKLTEKDELMCYYGHKFEQYVTSPTQPTDVPDTDAPIGTADEFVTVYKATLYHERSKLKVLYMGEVDCLTPDGEYIELKTTKGGLNLDRQFQKVCKWWLQSYLVKCDRIYVGHRTSEGFVYGISKLGLNDQEFRSKMPMEQMMNQIASFLNTVKRFLENDDDSCTIRKTEGQIMVTRTERGNNHGIFSEEFRNYINTDRQSRSS